MKSEKFENLALATTVVGSLLLSGTVILSLVRILLFLAVTLYVPTAFAQTTPAARLEAAIEKEQVDGNVKSAMDVYQKIAADNSAPKPVRAKALLQLAGSYEKLGQQAQKVYEQIVRDFANEPAAAQARIRLAALRQADRAAEPATLRQRRFGSVPWYSTDGQRSIDRDAATGAAVITDLATKTQRVLFKPKPGETFVASVPSRDFSLATLEFRRGQEPGQTLAVIKTDGTGYREIARMESIFQGPPTWSWDNRYILGSITRPDGTVGLTVISVSDGQIRDVLPGDHREHTARNACLCASFSPDGRFIAFSEGFSGSSKVFVVPAQGGEPQLVSGDANLLDWTRDGRYLAIVVSQGGSPALSLLPIKDGQAAGAPVFISYGTYLFGRTTATGALLYQSAPPRGVGAVALATLDAEGHLSAWKQLNLNGVNKDPYPTWSPDSNQIAYTASGAGDTTSTIRVHEIASGKDRELYRGGNLVFCAWATQHPNLFCTDFTHQGTLSISVDSGHTESLANPPGAVYIQQAIDDDRALILVRPTSEALSAVFPTALLLRWEIGTHQETVLAQGLARISPDSRWLLSIKTDEAGRGIFIRPVSGGDWKRLAHLRIPGPSGVAPIPIIFTSDGKWILYHDIDSSGNDGLYRVATAGGEPERLGEYPSKSPSGSLAISPDGRKILAVAPDATNPWETWLLENFVPAAK